MASNRRVEVKVAVDAKSVGAGVRQASRELSRLQSSTTAAGRAMSALGKVAKAGALAGVAGLTAAVVVGANELREQAAVSAQTATVLRNLGKTTTVTTKQVEGLASAIQSQTGAQDDQVQATSNTILRFGLIKKTGSAAEAELRRMTMTALDLSVATGKNLTSSTLALGRALADPERASGALRRAGVVLTAQQKEQIKTMAESGDVAGAQARVLELVESRVKGSALAYGKTIPGQVDKARRAFEDFSEGMIAAVAPAATKILPPLLSIMKALGPVIEEFGSALGTALTKIVNDQGIREFATTVKDVLVSGLRLAVSIGNAVLPVFSAIGSVLAGLVGIVKDNAAAMLLFSAALGAIVVSAAAGAVGKLAQDFVKLAAVQKSMVAFSAMGPMISGLGTAVSVLAGNFSKVSAASVGLAPGLTAAAGGVSRFATAGNVAKSALSTLGPSLLALAGGPVGAVILGVGALVGGVVALASGMFSGESASEAYARAMDEVKTASDGARGAIEGVRGAVITQAQASLALKEANRQVATAARELAAAEASGDPNRIRVARENLTRAELSAASAKDQLISSNRAQAQSFETLRGKISALPGSIASQNAAYKAMLPSLALGARANGEIAKQFAKVRAEYAQNLKSPKALADVKRDALQSADALKNVHTPAAKAARDALLELGNAKVGKGGSIAGLQGLVDNAVAKLDALNQKSGAAKTKTTSNLKGVGSGAANSVSGNMTGVFSAVQTIGQQIIDETERIKREANANLADTGKKSSPPVVGFVRANMENITATVATGGKKIANAARRATTRANAELAPIGGKVDAILGGAAVAAAKRREAGTAKGSEARSNAKSSRETAESNAGSLRSKFSGMFSEAASRITSKLSSDSFQRFGPGPNDIRLVKSKFSNLQTELDGAMKTIDLRIESQGNAIEKAMKGALVENLDQIMPQFAARVRSLKTKADELSALEKSLTPAEDALRKFDAAAQAADLGSAISDAQAKLQEARNYGSADDVVAAEKALAEAQRASARAELQKTAEQERTDRDALIETKRAELEADATTLRADVAAQAELDRVQQQAIFEARRLEMEAELARMEAQFARIPALLRSKNPEARKELLALKKQFGDYGYGAGDMFVDELTQAMNGMGPRIGRKLAREIKPYLELNSPAKVGPLSELDEWFVPFGETLMGGIDMREAERTADGIASMLRPSGSISSGRSGGTVVNVTVSGNEFSAREFARKLQPELDRIISYSGV